MITLSSPARTAQISRAFIRQNRIVMGVAAELAGEKRHQVHAVESHIRWRGSSRNRERGRQQIKAAHGAVIDLARGEPGLPLDEKRHADAAFEQGALFAGERGVQRTVALERAAVVAQEDDEGAFLQVVLAQLIEHDAHGVIHAGDHRGVEAALLVGNVGESLQQLRGRLLRGVRSVERHVEEPGLRLCSGERRPPPRRPARW